MINHEMAERSLVGSLMFDPQSIRSIRNKVSIDDFSNLNCKKIFMLISDISSRNESPLCANDFKNEITRLQIERMLPDFYSYIYELRKETNACGNIDAWAAIVVQFSVSRSLKLIRNEVKIKNNFFKNIEEVIKSIMDNPKLTKEYLGEVIVDINESLITLYNEVE